jgi:anti-anti-sigma factor
MHEAPEGSMVTLVLEGELETHNWERLRDTIVDTAAEGTTTVVLDLGEVTFFDSSAIRALLGARTALEPRGVTIALGPRSDIVQRVVELTGLLEHFPVVDGPGERAP